MASARCWGSASLAGLRWPRNAPATDRSSLCLRKARATGAADLPDWNRLAAIAKFPESAPLVIVPAAILAETGWLQRLAEARIEPAAWAAVASRIVLIPAGSVQDALAALAEDGEARDLSTVERRLARRFGPPAPISGGIDPMTVETHADIAVAERRLMQALVKDTDGFMARHVERPISLGISRLLLQPRSRRTR